MKSISLHAGIIKTIRTEYDHNMSQQVYVSDEVWEMIQQAKDQLIRVINVQVRSVAPDSDSIELGKLIIEAAKKKRNGLLMKH